MNVTAISKTNTTRYELRCCACQFAARERKDAIGDAVVPVPSPAGLPMRSSAPGVSFVLCMNTCPIRLLYSSSLSLNCGLERQSLLPNNRTRNRLETDGQEYRNSIKPEPP